jgi:hypothetical protein
MKRKLEFETPVVVIVRVTGTLVVEAVSVTVLGLKLQVLFGGSPAHMDGDRVPDPIVFRVPDASASLTYDERQNQ